MWQKLALLFCIIIGPTTIIFLGIIRVIYNFLSDQNVRLIVRASAFAGVALLKFEKLNPGMIAQVQRPTKERAEGPNDLFHKNEPLLHHNGESFSNSFQLAYTHILLYAYFCPYQGRI